MPQCFSTKSVIGNRKIGNKKLTIHPHNYPQFMLKVQRPQNPIRSKVPKRVCSAPASERHFYKTRIIYHWIIKMSIFFSKNNQNSEKSGASSPCQFWVTQQQQLLLDEFGITIIPGNFFRKSGIGHPFACNNNSNTKTHFFISISIFRPSEPQIFENRSNCRASNRKFLATFEVPNRNS